MYVVQYVVAPGACGIDTRLVFPTGEHPHASYSVSITETVVVLYPCSTRITRPNPSSVRVVHRPFVVSFIVAGIFVYWYVVVAPDLEIDELGLAYAS